MTPIECRPIENTKANLLREARLLGDHNVVELVVLEVTAAHRRLDVLDERFSVAPEILGGLWKRTPRC